jgi:hypothetical protein
MCVYRGQDALPSVGYAKPIESLVVRLWSTATAQVTSTNGRLFDNLRQQDKWIQEIVAYGCGWRNAYVDLILKRLPGRSRKENSDKPHWPRSLKQRKRPPFVLDEGVMS